MKISIHLTQKDLDVITEFCNTMGFKHPDFESPISIEKKNSAGNFYWEANTKTGTYSAMIAIHQDMTGWLYRKIKIFFTMLKSVILAGMNIFSDIDEISGYIETRVNGKTKQEIEDCERAEDWGCYPMYHPVGCDSLYPTRKRAAEINSEFYMVLIDKDLDDYTKAGPNHMIIYRAQTLRQYDNHYGKKVGVTGDLSNLTDGLAPNIIEAIKLIDDVIRDKEPS